MTKIYLSLGTNLGDREANLTRALELLSARVRIVKVSSRYKTEPVGYRDQPWFLNLAAVGETDLSPEALLDFTQSVERAMKRVKNFVNGPRIIDVDILLYGDQTIRTDRLVIPHPRMLERAFVLVPLLEVAPDLVIGGRPLREFMELFQGEEIYKNDEDHGPN